MPTTAILGGGLSGLCTAHFLSRSLPSSHKILLIDRASRFGGWIQSTTTDNGISFETGPRSVRPVGLPGHVTLKLIQDLGLQDSLITVKKSDPAAQNRFIFFNGKLHKAPNSVLSAIKASTQKASPFYGLMKAVLAEPFVKPAPKDLQDESVYDFVSRRLGAPITENMLSALVHGIYAGNTRNLSIRAVFPSLWELEQSRGSIVKGMIMPKKKKTSSDSEAAMLAQLQSEIPDLTEQMKDVSVYSLQGGLEGLPRALIKSLEKSKNVQMRPSSELESVNYNKSGFDLRVSGENLPVQNIVSALPSATLGKFIDAPHLSANPSVTVGVVNLAFSSDIKTPVNGFGYLIPETVSRQHNPHHALGVIFDSDIFPSSDGLTKVTVMMGGRYWTGSQPPPRNALLQQALDTLKLHGIIPSHAEPAASQTSLHPDCIPQYGVGHVQRMRELHDHLLQQYEGRLAVVGSSYSGVGVNDCVLSTWLYQKALTNTGTATGLERYAKL